MAGLMGLLLLASCTPTPLTDLQPVSPPDLDRLEPVARDTLRAAQRSLEQALAHGLPASELADRFGDTGRLYLAHAFRDPAATCFRNAGALDATNGAWPYLAGVAHQEAGRLALAATAFGRALDLEPDNLAARLRRGRVMLDSGQPRSAAQDFRAVLAETADATADASARRARGAAYYGLGLALRQPTTLESSIEALESARALAPDANAIHYALGLAYRDRGDADRARRNLARAGTRRPRFDDPRTDSLGSLLTGARVHIALGGQARRLGRRNEAFQLFQKAVEIEPENARAHHNVGAMLAEAGQAAEALPFLERATALDPESIDARFDFASALAQAGRLRESLNAFDAVVARAPGDAEARDRRERVARVLAQMTDRRPSDEIDR